MTLSAAAARRLARQIALPELGVAGQTRLGASRVAVVGTGAGLEAAALYLAGAGVGALRLLGADQAESAHVAQVVRDLGAETVVETPGRPADGAGWRAALAGCGAALCLERGAHGALIEAAGAPVVTAWDGGADAVVGPERFDDGAPPADAMALAGAVGGVTRVLWLLLGEREREVDEQAVARARARVAESITDLVGDTPMVRLRSFEQGFPNVEIWVKCEFMNPGGSVKDRAALRMIRDALADGRLDPAKQEVIDSTSGNTGIAYSLIGAALGLRVTLVMPANVSWARRQIARAFGTSVVFSSAMEGSDGAITLARRMVDAEPSRWFYPNQYGNESNPAAHYEGTGREIWEQTGGRITHFVAGVGTSGTVMGTGRRLKAENPAIRVYAVEPDDALHGLEGLKHMASSIVPDIFRPQELDGILAIGTEEAWDVSERLSREEGLLVGHSSGAAVAGAVRLAKQLAAAGEPGVVVTVFPDRAERYFEPPLSKQAGAADEISS